MTEAPDEVRALAEQRETARRARDYALADDLRRRMAELGFEVTDTPDGPVLAPVTPGGGPGPEGDRAEAFARSEDVPSALEEEPAFDATVQWVVQGWPQDVLRGIRSFRRHAGGRSVHHVVVDLTAHGTAWPDEVEVVRLRPEVGWGAARNAGLRRCAGRVIVLVDGSVEATGDPLDPIDQALRDPSVGVTGPFGIVSDDLREFRESAGPEVDAVESYLMAFPRELVVRGLRFDEGFRFYRTADIEVSFQVKAMGLRATLTPVPVRRHVHRMWEETPEDERARLSKRNFYRFLDRWRGRADLLVSRGGPGSAPSGPTPPRPGKR